MGKVYKGDVGTEIILDCGSDISTATVLKIKARKPSGTTVEWGAVLSGTNALKHVIAAGELDEAGTWLLQAYVSMPTWSGLGETFSLHVYGAHA